MWSHEKAHPVLRKKKEKVGVQKEEHEEWRKEPLEQLGGLWVTQGKYLLVCFIHGRDKWCLDILLLVRGWDAEWDGVMATPFSHIYSQAGVCPFTGRALWKYEAPAGTICDTRIELELAVCTANTFSSVFSLQPHNQYLNSTDEAAASCVYRGTLGCPVPGLTMDHHCGCTVCSCAEVAIPHRVGPHLVFFLVIWSLPDFPPWYSSLRLSAVSLARQQPVYHFFIDTDLRPGFPPAVFLIGDLATLVFVPSNLPVSFIESKFAQMNKCP